MRHLAVGSSCPIDGAAVSRTHCSICPDFVSFRSVDGVATVGCTWGDDVSAWLRREMSAPQARLERTGRVDPAAAAPASRPALRLGLGGGVSLAMFAAAFGIGLVLSAYDRS